MEIILHPNIFSVEVALNLLIALLTLAGLAIVLFLFIRPLLLHFYDKLDRRGQFVSVRGHVIEKRYDHGTSGGVVVVIDGIVEHIQLPQELFRSIEVDTEIDLKALYGKLSNRLLQIKPENFRVDTYA